MTSEREELLVDLADNVLVITINRPHARNAITQAVAEDIAAALDLLDSRDDLSVGVITGAGGAFCSGMDLKAFARGERPRVEGRGFAGLTEAPPRKPLIAAVEGPAVAGGWEIVLACDMVVAARTARFGLPEVKRGLVATAGGLLRLPNRVSEQLAMEFALTGDLLLAERAYQIGLVNRLSEEGEALRTALDLAATISANGPLAVEASKRVIRQHTRWPEEERFARQRLITDPVIASADAAEGARAFAEKRPPRWTGR
ncbi:crotonase/enoyl-CoA hydratase family protein [Nonomuraea ceibae]|uniref:crotonase/enoyl-CoA hydratase family protein n=1 Tax=Nonomuraea ceibae TaxID=1935170 RepID=UPI001C60281C|nr:crotonase/enoyl-CoA hydratase family protein [Nonomuraea ceibae]